MNMFHTRQTNILTLYTISLSVSITTPSALTVKYAFSMEGSTQYGLQGRAPNPAGLLMTSVITSLLLLTPALKNNIYPVCHHETVGVCICMCVCVFLSSWRQTLMITSTLTLSLWLLIIEGNTQPVCVKQIFLRKSESRELNTSA